MTEATDQELGIPEGLDPAIRDELRKSRATQKERDQALKEAQGALRELALLRAGIPDTPLGKLFAKAYDGEISPEAIKASATEYGVIGAPVGEAQGVLDAQAQLEAQRQIAQAGGQPPPTPARGDEFMQSIKGKTPDEVMAIVQQYQDLGIRQAET